MLQSVSSSFLVLDVVGVARALPLVAVLWCGVMVVAFVVLSRERFLALR